jgi:hypothetical protein
MKIEDAKKLAQRFCANKNVGRRALETPFVSKNMVYASDGRIGISIRCEDRVEKDEGHENFPKKCLIDILSGERVGSYTILSSRKDEVDLLYNKALNEYVQELRASRRNIGSNPYKCPRCGEILYFDEEFDELITQETLDAKRFPSRDECAYEFEFPVCIKTGDEVNLYQYRYLGMALEAAGEGAVLGLNATDEASSRILRISSVDEDVNMALMPLRTTGEILSIAKATFDAVRVVVIEPDKKVVVVDQDKEQA